MFTRFSACFLTLFLFVSTLTLISCGGGGGGGSSLPDFQNLTLEKGSRVSEKVGREGATLTTTDAHGVQFELVIPAGALVEEITIQMVPVSEMVGVPQGANVIGGVHLLPEGQKFLEPCTLRITLPTDPGQTIIPFTYDGDLQEKHLYPAVEENGVIEYEIVHFSGYSAMIGILGDLMGDQWFPDPSNAGDAAIQDVVEATQTLTGDARSTAVRNALQTWLDTVIEPRAAQVQGSTFDPDAYLLGTVPQLHNEMLVFNLTQKFAILSGVGDLGGVPGEFTNVVKDTAKHVIDVSNPGCTTYPGLAVLGIAPVILSWQSLADGVGADEIDSSLTRAQVLEDLCVQVVYDENGGVDFPSGIQPGQSGTLRVRAGYSINGGPTRFDVPMQITMGGTTNVDPSGIFEFNVASGATAQKTFLWEPATEEMRLDINANMAVIPDLIQSAFVVRGTGGNEEDIPEGTWQKNDHTWTFNGGSTVQQRPTRFIIGQKIGDLGQPLGAYQIAQDSQGNPVIITMFGVFVKPNQSGGFSGENSGTMFQGATGTVEVTGKILPNGNLDIRWEASLNHGEHIVGDEEIPKFVP